MVIGTMNQPDIQLRLYRAILLAGAALSLVCVLGNYISAFPFHVNIKWIVLFLVAITAFFLSGRRKHRIHIMFSVYLFLIFFFLPFAFIDSGGSKNNAIGYAFLLVISITYLFTGWRRTFLVVGLVAVFIFLHALEYLHPELIQVYSNWSQFIDRMIQIPMLLLAAYFVILQFAREYERINSKLEHYASKDALTGIYNRRVFDQAIEEASADRRSPAYLVLIDLDNFKRINDTYGHSAGDKVLQKLAGLLQDSLGQGRNIACRWGGDEFAIIYYGDRDKLTLLLEDVKSSFAAYVASYGMMTGISYSITSVQQGQAEQVLVRAGRGLYEEKQRKEPC